MKQYLPEYQNLNKEFLPVTEVALRISHFCLIYEPKLKNFEAVYQGKIQQVTSEGKKGQIQALGFMLKQHFPRMCFKTLQYYQDKDPLCIKVHKELKKGTNKACCIIEEILFKKVDENLLVIWSKCLNIELIQKYHSLEMFFHIAGKKLKKHIS